MSDYCAICKFYKPPIFPEDVKDGRGFCHRYPPPYARVWDHIDWCGEYYYSDEKYLKLYGIPRNDV